VQVFGDPRIALNIPAGSFYPAPKIDSSVLVVNLLSEPRIPQENLPEFFSLAKTAFSHKRKMLHNALAGYGGLGSEGPDRLLQLAAITVDRRPQTLSLEEWGRLAAAARQIRAENG
jgi:16S rRNA (adenine1518-N6/adenine1519-N6)-dimethyltransferase